MSSKKRKWSDEYVQHGFTCITDRDGSQRPVCMICNAIYLCLEFEKKNHILFFTKEGFGEWAYETGGVRYLQQG